MADFSSLFAQPEASNFYAATVQPQFQSNLLAANDMLKLNPQERALYQRHIDNLIGGGGVDHPDGSRSTLYQAVQEKDGRFYNIPTVWGGKIETEKYKHPQTGEMMDVPNQTALRNVEKTGWDRFPSYENPDEAERRYQLMHSFMDSDTQRFLGMRK